jgi:hypothetical protein
MTMTSCTVPDPTSARELLFPDEGAGDPARLLSRAVRDSDAAKTAMRGLRHLSSSARRALDEQLGGIASGLLAIDLGDGLVLGWLKLAALTEAARRTLETPSSEEIVELVSHRVTSDFRPSIDLMVDGIRVNTFEFHLSVVFDVTGVSAVVKDGALTAVRGGDCVITAIFTLEGAPLAQRKRSVDVAMVVPLRRQVRLVQRDAVAVGQLSAPAPRIPLPRRGP